MDNFSIIINPITAIYYITFTEIIDKFKTCLKEEYVKED